MRRSAPLALAIALLACAHAKEQKYDLVIPPPPEKPRYKLEHIYAGADDYAKRSPIADFFLGKQSAGERHLLFKPSGVASDGKGRVFVSDTAKPPHVQVFDDVKKEVRILGVEGEGRLLLPLGLAVDAQGDLFVADARQKKVFEFGPDEKFRAAYGTPQTLERPTGVAVDAARGRLYVCDTKGHRVQVFGLADGKLVRTLGERGSKPGQFNFPEGITLGPDGKLYVVDAMNFRYEVFDKDGKFLAAHGQIGQEPGTFARPKGIALDAEGHVYVSDAAFDNVQVFDADGRLLIWIGGPGVGPGEFQLAEGVFVDPQNAVYVVDQYNKRVQRFRYLPEAAGPAKPAVETAEVKHAEVAPPK